jgi:PAS domain S-box-containing protein
MTNLPSQKPTGQSQAPSVANSATEAGWSARPRQEADTETLRMTRLLELQARLSESDLDLDAFLDAVMRQMQSLTPATGAVLALRAADDIVIRALSGIAGRAANSKVHPETSILRLCTTTAQSCIVEDARADPRVDRETFALMGARSAIAAPLMQDRHSFGCLLLMAAEPAAFGTDDLQTLRLLTGMLGTAFALRLRLDEYQTLLAERTEALEWLASAERRFRAAMEHSATGMSLIAPSGVWLYVNPALCRMFGYKAGELIGANNYDLTLPGELPDVERRVQRLLSGEVDTYQIEKGYRRKDGGIAWVLQTLSTVRDKHGLIEYVVSEFIDIGPRRAAEEASAAASRRLLEANRLLVMAEQLAHVGHWRVDARRGQVFWSDEVYRIHGVSPEAGPPTIDQALAYYHPEDRAVVARNVEAALANGSPYSTELRIIRSDGTVRDVSTIGQCEWDDAGHVSGIFGVFQDVTVQHNDARALHILNNRLLLATHAGRVGIWEMPDIDGEIVCNDVMWQLFGLEPPLDSLKAADWLKALHPDDMQSTLQALAACWRGEANYDVEYRVIWPNGEVHVLQARASVERDAVGNPVRMIGTNWDVTEMRNLTLQLAEEKERAEQANVAKSNFLAMMSHEIRTPMNGVLGMNALLLETVLTPHQRHLAETVRSSAESLLTIIDDVLDLSKLEAGRIDLEEIDFDLPDAVDNAVAPFLARAQANGVAFRVELGLIGPRCYRGDPARLRQIGLNLISNAIKFTERGEIVVCITDRTIGDGVSRLRFEVRDTGPGVSAAAKERLFRPFEQADSTIARRFGGTGLGLSICKRLVERMGGEIGVLDREGGGTIFWFEVELAIGTAEPLPAPRSAVDASVTPSSGHILLAEDNIVNIEFASMVLESRGYTVDLAGDGFEAVAAAQRRAYDLILMDMQMPRLDGLSATREIRRLDGPCRRVPIVAMTANAMKEDEQRCLDAGMDDYVSKPIDPHRLNAVVARWLQASRSSAQ